MASHWTNNHNHWTDNHVWSHLGMHIVDGDKESMIDISGEYMDKGEGISLVVTSGHDPETCEPEPNKCKACLEFRETSVDIPVSEIREFIKFLRQAAYHMEMLADRQDRTI